MQFTVISTLMGLLAPLAVAGPIAEPARRQLLGGSKARTPIDATTYAKIAKYPAYSTMPYLLPFVNPCAAPYGSDMYSYINNTLTDTQMALFRHDNDGELVVGIPGSNSTQDYLTDASYVPVPYGLAGCETCLVHLGFLNAWKSVEADIVAGLRQILASHPDYRVVVAGHSLGGALCILAYAALTVAGLPVESAYCSGAPRVGDFQFANFIDQLSGANDTNIGNMYRITHFNDGVPQLPAGPHGFRHPRTEIYEEAYNSSIATTYRCYGQEPTDCNNAVGLGKGINSAHSTYVNLRYNCLGGFDPNPSNSDTVLPGI